MSKRVLTSFLFLFFVVSVSGITAVQADETSSRTSSVKKPKKVEQCTEEDLASIKKFDREAKKYLKKYKQHIKNFRDPHGEGARAGDTVRRAQSYTKKMDEVYAFFMSEEYKEMEPVYQRCGQNIPSLAPGSASGTPYWVPEDLTRNNGSSGCTSCGK